jgi:hypothetical protein
MTDTEWVQLNMMTGEIRMPEEEQIKKHRKPDIVFTALAKLCGYDGSPLTNSLRGALNKACREIKDVEIGTYDEIVLLIDAFGPWFKTYRLKRFNEVCRRAPYPMETAKLWPEYRKHDITESSFKSDWEKYKLAHPEVIDHD